MSGEAVTWVRMNPADSPTQQAVLEELALASIGRGLGARRSYRSIARKTRHHRNTVLRALRALEQADRIRKHRGHGDECDRCASAERGTAVYDVVMPATPVPAGQDNLFADATRTGTTDWHNVAPGAVPVTEAHRHTHSATSGTSTVPHVVKEEGQQQQQDAREFSNESIAAVDGVVEALTPTRLFVDRYAIEAVVMHADLGAIPAAVANVIALASDPAYRLPKGGAARMLAAELRRLQATPPTSQFGARRAAPRRGEPGGALPDQFAKYNVAAGLAS